MGAPAKFSEAFAGETPAADFIPYTSHVTPHVVRLESGDYVQVVRVQGAAHESANVSDINVWHEQLNNYLRNIASPNVAVWTHIVRREYNEFPGGEFAPGFCADLNERYRTAMAGERLLVNELYISLVYRPQPVKAARMLDKLFSRGEEDQAAQMGDDLERMTELAQTTLAALDRYEPELLGCYEYKGHAFSAALEFLAYLVNCEWRRVPLLRAPISSALATSRPFFGKGGLMSIKGPTRTQYAAALTFQQYPAVTCPGILNDLLSMPCELVVSQSFTFISKASAMAAMKMQQSRMINAGDVARSQIADIDDAMDDLASNLFVLGTHSLSVFVRAADQKALNEVVSDAGSALSEAGVMWAREDMGIAGAFWAQLPGNFEYRVRVGDITSRNFSGLSCLHNYPIGRIRGNQWGDAVTMFKTTSGAPFYFSFHKGEAGSMAKAVARLDPNHKDLANTIVIGKSGTGKTVLEMMLLAQAQKFHRPDLGKNKRLSSVVFDKDLGASVAVRAMGGRYYALKNGVPSGFNPFRLAPTPNNLTFLDGLVHQLVKRADMPLSPRQEKEISNAVRAVMAADPAYRRLSYVMQMLDHTVENGLAERLAKWCHGGPLAWLFDNEEDTLTLDGTPIVGFDVTEFLENDETRTPTIMYLFHRVESLLDGRRVPIFMDEFWKLLDDPAFEDLASNKLVTIRKQDGFLVMFTQSPQQVLQSPIAFAIVSQTATKIFLPNPEADRADYIDGFKLSEREFEIVRSLGEKSRRFLVKQGDSSAVCELNLRGFDDELAVLSGNTATAALCESVIATHGTDPAVWLPEFHRARKGV